MNDQSIHFRSVLARRMTLMVLLFSSVITLIGTGLQLYLDYRHEIHQLTVRFEEIRQTHLDTLTRQLWVTDADAVLLQMEGIRRLPEIRYLEITRPNATTLRVGEPETRPASMIERSYSLEHDYREKRIPLGTLRIQADLGAIHQRLLDRLLVILVTQTIKTFLVSLFILALFHYLIGRHLAHMARHVRSAPSVHGSAPLLLTRRPLSDRVPDELDQLVDALNRKDAAYRDLLQEISLSNQELMSHRDRLEETVRARTMDLMTANQAKSRFLANMSHELRTPLNAVLGFAQLIAKDPQITPAQKGHVEIILHSGAHLLDIINDILDLARIESGRMEVESVPFDLGALLHELVAMLRGRAEEKGLELAIDQSSSFPRLVRSDPAKLRQILINLIGNAIKFTRVGGVTLKLYVNGLIAPGNKRVLWFEILDTGIGISPEEIERIQMPFVQLNQSGGTGLGLAISRELIGLLGGELRITSVPGQGSDFAFSIAFESCASHEVQSTHDKNAPVIRIDNAGEFGILVVEDQVENRLLMQHLLSMHGFPLRMAENGQEGVRIVQEWQPRLVMLDRRMPVMDGLTAVRQMRALPEGRQAVIIAVTAHAFDNERKEMLDAGCDDFLAKPFSENELHLILRKHLPLTVVTGDEERGAVVVEETWNPQAFASLPPDLIEMLHSGLVRLDLEAIRVVIARIMEQDLMLGNRLQRAVERFDFAALRKAVSVFLGEQT
ncbi:MAG: response regulator [Magnetococcales bacterium]|nr:response regulator [Magnetococcales bacterium]